ncbi:MAG TPA: mannitol dehydrogenase family protein [Rhodanobacteraceae bacterium]
MSRLDLASLDRLPPVVARSTYRVADVGIGIVHLGIGAFHRAHQAIYTDDAIAIAGGNWGICGVSLRSPDVRDRLAPQEGLYTAIEKSPDRIRRRVVGSVREVLFQGEQYEAMRRRLIARETRIVSLTVTEKGYCHEPATGRLDFSHPDIVRDLQHFDAPHSVPGLLAWALNERRRTHGTPLTIVCCDNLPQNGGFVCGLAVAFANMRDPSLADWIGKEIAFPSTMVDRIVPATTPADIADNNAALGVDDAAPVVHEPFVQWVIEDRFATDRPAWDAAGAALVSEVEPFEKMKLRLLNASHSAFAYLGFLAGFEFIYQVAARPEFVLWMRRFMGDEVTPSLVKPQGINLASYREALVRRFANPALPHRTQQIAMDGSQKLPQRILGTVRDNLAANRPVELATLAVAGWMRYVYGEDERGRPIAVADPLAPKFATLAERHRRDPEGFAEALLDLRVIFDEDLHNEPRFTTPVKRWLAQLFADGAAKTVAAAVAAR